MKQVLLLLAFAILSNASLLDPSLLDPRLRTESSQKGLHPGHDTSVDFYKARYFARKAHDIAALQTKIFGLGNGFYGYRYGSNSFLKPHFPEYLGLKYQTAGFPHPNLNLQFLAKSLPFYNPSTYDSSFSQHYGYGKGYSYSSSKFKPSPIDYNLPLNFKISPFSPGYKYSYFVQGPFSKLGTKIPFKGYDTIYGTRYFGLPGEAALWKSEVPAWNDYPIAIDPRFKGYDSIYGTRYGGFPNKNLSWKINVPAWNMVKEFKGYPNIYGPVSSGFPSKIMPGTFDSNLGPINVDFLSKKTSGHDGNFDEVDSRVIYPKGAFLVNPNHDSSSEGKKGTGYDMNYRPIASGVVPSQEEFFVKNPVPYVPVPFPNIEPQNLASSSSADFYGAPGQ